MNRFILFLLVCASSLHAIGDPHATWASQATQGTMWRGTSAIINERYRITVQPAYLDVEVDWEFNVGGYNPPDSFRNSLEIVGNLNITQDASVIGMLLWNGEEILKAKLKPVNIAREQYEQVVDRNAPVPPKPMDPVIFEYGWGRDNYYMSIFPVTWGGTRKVRMRYLIPAVNMNGTIKMPCPRALCYQNPSFTLIRGAGVSSFIMEGYNSSQRTPVTGDSMTFGGSSPAISSGVSLIQPVLADTTTRQSVIYTGVFSADTGAFSGHVSQVVGLPACEIIARAGMREDFVILWRWNHPEALRYYASQIKKQAAVISAFCAMLDMTDRRAGMVVDIPGRSQLVFELGSQRRGYTRMMGFLDSLAGIQAVQFTGGNPQSYNQRQIDSLANQSIDEFTTALSTALAMLERSSAGLKTVLLVTAGPRRITDTRQSVSTVQDYGTLVSALYPVASGANLQNVDLSSVRDLYWPGLNTAPFMTASRSFTVTASIGIGTDTIRCPVQNARSTQSSYHWGYVSPDLDLKVYSMNSPVNEIRWTFFSNNARIAEYVEKPLIVTLAEGKLFATALAGTRQLKALNGKLPLSLAGALGFVDEKYALLALEEDTMPAAIEERYRFAGVPLLDEKEIGDTAENTTAQNMDSPNATDLDDRIKITKTQLSKETVVTLAAGRLHVDFGEKLRKAGAEARIRIFSISGKLLYELTLPTAMQSALETILPANVLNNQAMVVIQLSVGTESVVKRLMVR